MARPENKLAFDGGWEYAPAPESTDHVSIRKRYGLFIDGEFVAPQKGRYFDSINPASEEKLSRVAEADAGDVDLAVRAARKAYRNVWSKMKPAERGKYIFRIARIIQERAREYESRPGLVQEIVENGCQRARAVAGELRRLYPATAISPPVAGNRPHNMRNVVVLPAPFRPSRPTFIPRAMLRSTPSSRISGP